MLINVKTNRYKQEFSDKKGELVNENDQLRIPLSDFACNLPDAHRDIHKHDTVVPFANLFDMLKLLDVRMRRPGKGDGARYRV